MNDLERRLVAAVEAAFERDQVPWFRRLVDQPSHTRAPDDVEAAACIVDELAASLDMTCRRVPDPDETFADHRVFATPATDPEDRALALVGHVDTVFPRDLGFLELRRDDGDDGPGTGDVVRGPGVLDMKSGLSAVLFALRALRDVAPERFTRIKARFVCNTDEEVGSPSSHALFAELAPRVTKALVFEGGRDGDRVITRRKGGGVFMVTVTGRSAHAGIHHDQGRSAIHALALLVDRIEQLTDYDRGVTLNVGLIEGGTAKNTVPEHAHCVIDTRFLTAADGHWVKDALAQLVATFSAGDGVPERLRNVDVALSGGITRLPLEASDASQALRRAYESCADAVGLGVGEAPLQGGGSDANLLSAHGVPCIDGLGPYGKHFHRVEEWSSLASLRRRTQALACFLARESG